MRLRIVALAYFSIKLTLWLLTIDYAMAKIVLTLNQREGHMAQKHTPATIGIQRRLEKWELDHLRALCAVQAEEIERLKRELEFAEDCAIMWQRGHEALAEHLDSSSAVGLTQSGELVVVKGGAA